MIELKIIDIESQKRKLLEEVRMQAPGYHALKKLRIIRENIDWAVEGYRNSLSILSDTTYEDRKHFLLELIQNADDADYGDNAPEITFSVTSEGLELFYNEVGFTVEDIISITDTGSSTKKSKKNSSTSFIGEKGIGFKSVFALAESVEIQSGHWHFLLEKEKCIVPLPISGTRKFLNGTRQRIKFLNPNVTNEIYNELKRYVSGEVESFLYLQKISKFTLIDKRDTKHEKHIIEILPSDRAGDRLTLRTVKTGEEREFLLYSENIVFPKELVASRWEKIGTSMGSVERKVILAAMLNSGVKDQSGRLFCYLPTSVKLPIPVFLQVDGMTKADRERLHDPHSNEWNRYLLSKLPDIISRAIVSWSHTMDSPDLFQRFIPVTGGEDQLHLVFSETIKLLRGYNWIKVTGDEPSWQKPESVVRVPPYINNLIKCYPDLRNSIEKSLIRYILDEDWSENPDLSRKLLHYGVEIVPPLKLLGALISSGFPNEILTNDAALIELYSFMTDMIDFKFSKFSNPSDHHIRKVIEFIRELKIFPIKNEGFSTIGDMENVYFITSEAANIDRLSGNIRLVDPNYTVDTLVSGEISDSHQAVSDISLALKRLLVKLGIKELSRVTLLTDFILPELKSTLPFTIEDRLEKLIALYSYFSEMRRQNKDISRLISTASEIWLYGSDMKLHQIKNLLIPALLRLSETENIYDHYDLNEVQLTDVFLDKISDEKVFIHDFLIALGIKHKPLFHSIQETYQDSQEFSDEDNSRFMIWTNRIKNDYTKANNVVVERVVLDQIDQTIIRSGKVSVEFERQLYTDWLKKFSNNEINDYTYYYKGQAIPGYFTVTYKRQEKRCLQLQDINWAGVESEYVPIETYGGRLLLSSKVFVIPPIRSKQIQYLLYHLNGILSEDKESNHSTYHRLYANSLNIRDMTMKETESLWSRVDESRFDDILSLIIELLKMNLPLLGLKIIDKNTGDLRSITDFRLGQISYEGSPLIELQYGNLGTLLGSMCELPKDGTIESYKNVVREVLTTGEIDTSIIRRFLALLQDWHSYGTEDKIQIIDEFKSGIGERKAPILILGNSELYNDLNRNGIWAILITDDTSSFDFEALNKAANEIGFIMPDSFGKLQITNQSMLNNDEAERCNSILQSYIEFLEDKEIARLNQKLKLFSGVSQVFRHVSFADSISRMIKSGNIEYQLTLPYLDEKDRRIILPKSLGSYEIIKTILIMIEFAPRRNVERDMAYIKKMDDKKARENQYEHFDNETNTDKSEPDYNFKDSYSPYAQVSREIVSSTLGDAGIGIHTTKDSNTTTYSSVRPVEELLMTDDVGQIVRNLEESLKTENISETEVRKGWNLGPNSEEEDTMRNNLVKELTDSFNNGPEIYRRKLRNVLRPQRTYNGVSLSDFETLIDKDSFDPKAFLESEYDCRCQICSKQLVFKSGRKWVSVYHIQERKSGAWFYDRPFNFLGLCPDCYTIARYGGTKDFSNLIIEARNVITGDTFAEPVPEFNGDYYLVDVQLDNQNYKMKVSKVHMSYFAALIQTDE